MPRYDAFGREIGEDTLAEQGWGASSVEQPSTSAAPQQAAPVSAPPGIPGARRRRGGVRAFVLVVVLLVVGGAGASIFFAVDAAEDVADGVFETITEPQSGAPAEQPAVPQAAPEEQEPAPAQPAQPAPAPKPSGPPTGLGRGSLVRPGEFSAALARLRRERLGSLRLLRLAPERIDAQLLTKGGRLRSVQLRHDGSFQQFSTSGAGFGHLKTIPFASIDRNGPAKLTRGVADRLGSKPSRLDYLAMLDIGGTLQWTIVFKSGAQFIGDAKGNVVRRIN